MYCILRPCLQRCYRPFTRLKLKYVLIAGLFLMLLEYFGVFVHLFEVTYDENFVYPYEGDIHEFVQALKHHEKPSVEPINTYNYSYVYNNKLKCVDPGYSSFRVVYVVKSAIRNIERRATIRNSWGFEKRFFDVPSRTVFLLGVIPGDEELQAKIEQEEAKYKDIVQVDFIDDYYNNTIKTMTGFKWLMENCLNSKFYMFVDDDMYVSVKNVLRFIRNPANYPDYLKEPKKFGAHKREISASMLQLVANESLANSTKTEKKNRKKRQIFDLELPEDVRLFAGYVFVSSPHRHRSSKWYVPYSEYPYHLWPPYVTAGAYILSRQALIDLYYTSLYTKLFRFDDIFLGLVAKKADIEPFHCEEFHFYKKDYTKFNYKYVISSHGYEDPNELLYVWNEQKALGNA